METGLGKHGVIKTSVCVFKGQKHMLLTHGLVKRSRLTGHREMGSQHVPFGHIQQTRIAADCSSLSAHQETAHHPLNLFSSFLFQVIFKRVPEFYTKFTTTMVQ